MKSNILNRLEAIEQRTTRAEKPIRVRFAEGFRPLPDSYQGERHQVFVATEEQNGRLNGVIEERKGPAPEEPESPYQWITVHFVSGPFEREAA